jgi:hypothetical protein
MIKPHKKRPGEKTVFLSPATERERKKEEINKSRPIITRRSGQKDNISRALISKPSKFKTMAAPSNSKKRPIKKRPLK